MSLMDEIRAIRPRAVLVIKAGKKIFYGTIEKNASGDAFEKKLTSEHISVDMHDNGGFEKVGKLPWALPESQKLITAAPGDIVLYSGDSVAVCYDENERELTRLARIGNVTKKELLKALGNGDASVSFHLEWSE